MGLNDQPESGALQGGCQFVRNLKTGRSGEIVLERSVDVLFETAWPMPAVLAIVELIGFNAIG